MKDYSVVVGIYGVSGAGKTSLLRYIALCRPEWRCLEGSQVIADVMKEEGNKFSDFGEKDDTEKNRLRMIATSRLQQYRGITIVVGHCSFPSQAVNTTDQAFVFDNIFTEQDAVTYDAIYYMDHAAERVYEQRQRDVKRQREECTLEVLVQWILYEKEFLCSKCKMENIHFSLVNSDHDNHQIIDDILNRFVLPTIQQINQESDEALVSTVQQLPEADVYLLIDGDRTISPIDTGKVFFDKVLLNDNSHRDPLKAIFKRYQEYSFQSFYEVALLYDRLLTLSEYNRISHKVGRMVPVYEPWLLFLGQLPSNVYPILVTSGSREIWQTILQKHPETSRMTLLAGNHVGLHDYILDSNAKAVVSRTLRTIAPGCSILCFGDSDIPMMKVSDRAYIVVDDRQNRSLTGYIRESVLQNKCRNLYQINLDCSARSFYHDGILSASLESLGTALVDGTLSRVYDYSYSPASQLLATQMRRADLIGPSLQSIHVDVGKFLADQLINTCSACAEALLQRDAILPHVQPEKGTFRGLVTAGANVLIVPLMRAGEPMSRGVQHRFPRAQLVHFYSDTTNTSLNNVLAAGQVSEILIVDAVVNSGDTVRAIIDHIHCHVRYIRVYVLTSVMQSDAAEVLPKEYPRVRFFALRVSDNKYTGSGSTDTGNRLFQTMQLI